jgi:hypothetical protein
MLDLMYSGHASAAWQFWHEAWPPSAEGEHVWLGHFRSRLQISPYWPWVKALNHL